MSSSNKPKSEATTSSNNTAATTASAAPAQPDPAAKGGALYEVRHPDKEFDGMLVGLDFDGGLARTESRRHALTMRKAYRCKVTPDPRETS